MRACARPRFELRNTASFPYALPSVEGEGLETTRPESVMASRKFGDWTPEAGTKVAEKNAFSSLFRGQLKPPLKVLSNENLRKIRGISATFATGRYGDPDLAGGRMGILAAIVIAAMIVWFWH
jgi:hypothetical protein